MVMHEVTWYKWWKIVMQTLNGYIMRRPLRVNAAQNEGFKWKLKRRYVQSRNWDNLWCCYLQGYAFQSNKNGLHHANYPLYCLIQLRYLFMHDLLKDIITIYWFNVVSCNIWINITQFWFVMKDNWYTHRNQDVPRNTLSVFFSSRKQRVYFNPEAGSWHLFVCKFCSLSRQIMYLKVQSCSITNTVYTASRPGACPEPHHNRIDLCIPAPRDVLRCVHLKLTPALDVSSPT